MKDKNKIILMIITFIVLLTASGLILAAAILYDGKKDANEHVDLIDCPMCGWDVKLYPVNESWYIQCTNTDCELRTGFFHSKAHLINQWNNMEIRE